ncbi:transmembrane protein, putative [Medicago truncatula]|uniref:Transmembrane protein, putative n=1 Tax=Medicago truncatula TaxID=3880 RepID=A0A072TM41_MEDTR|nr:transmembrane protein, putative [Medicago truncatula]
MRLTLKLLANGCSNIIALIISIISLETHITQKGLNQITWTPNFSKPYTRYIPPTLTDHPPLEPHLEEHYKSNWSKKLHMGKVSTTNSPLPQYVPQPPTNFQRSHVSHLNIAPKESSKPIPGNPLDYLVKPISEVESRPGRDPFPLGRN